MTDTHIEASSDNSSSSDSSDDEHTITIPRSYIQHILKHEIVEEPKMIDYSEQPELKKETLDLILDKFKSISTSQRNSFITDLGKYNRINPDEYEYSSMSKRNFVRNKFKKELEKQKNKKVRRKNSKKSNKE